MKVLTKYIYFFLIINYIPFPRLVVHMYMCTAFTAKFLTSNGSTVPAKMVRGVANIPYKRKHLRKSMDLCTLTKIVISWFILGWTLSTPLSAKKRICSMLKSIFSSSKYFVSPYSNPNVNYRFLRKKKKYNSGVDINTL